VACLVTSVFALFRLIPLWAGVPADAAPLRQTTMWKKLLPFAFWWWTMNSITNTFDIIDRFMIIHFSGLSETLSLDMVGQLHSARVLPVLFMGVAEMLAGLVTPYLSSDWEAGRRQQVSLRLNTVVKLFGVMLIVAAAVLQLIAPWLFGTLFKHKFSGGLEILPYCLAACIWLSMQAVMNNYLWCAEKSRYLTVTLAAGLAINVVLNLALLPVWGLLGVAVASAASKAVSFGLLWGVARLFGWKPEPGMLFVALLPILLPLGASLTLLVAIIGVCGALPSLPFFRDDERELIQSHIAQQWQKIKQRWVIPKASATP
jgi:O-antigen/teichoic acid export membrane protein